MLLLFKQQITGNFKNVKPTYVNDIGDPLHLKVCINDICNSIDSDLFRFANDCLLFRIASNS